MKRILYLHGLESHQGGEKVDFLAQENYVLAPEMDYTRKDLFTKMIDLVEHFDPDVIVGSSMGGYFSYLLGGLFKKKVVLFNPALHSRAFDPKVSKFANHHYPDEIVVVLGEEDVVIPPQKTLDYLKDQLAGRSVKTHVENIKDMGHRMNIAVFRDMYNKHIK